MKTNKSLLIKFLTVVSALCLSMAMVFGLVGCGEEAKSIVKTEIKNGELIITYSDNSTQNLGTVVGKDGEDGADYVGLAEKCTAGAEHKTVTHTIRYANCSETGIDLITCEVCKGFKVVENAKNPELHGTYVKDFIEGPNGQLVESLKFVSYETDEGKGYVAPTCTTPGKAVPVCSKCEASLEEEGVDYTIPALNHEKEVEGEKVSAFITISGTDIDANACMDGEFTCDICELCGVIENVEYTENSIGHHTADSTWVEIVKPTKTDKGLIKGICTHCQTEQTMELPAFNDTDYDHYLPDCVSVAAGESKVESYTYDKYGYSKTYNLEEVKIYHKKTVGGVAVSFEEKGVYTYDVLGLEDEDFSGEAMPDCSTERVAMVTCEDCGVPYAVFATGKHVFNVEPDKDAEGNVIKQLATCDEDGFLARYTCTACNGTKDPDNSIKFTIDEADGHDYELNGEFAYSNEKWVAPVKCSVCQHEDTIIGDIYEEGQATCETKAFRNIAYQLVEGGEVLYTGKLYYGELAKHYVIVGEARKEFVENGKYEYTALGLTDESFSGGAIPACNEAKIAWVTCAHCETPYAVQATGKHTIPAEPDKDAEGNVIKLASTCDTEGYTARYTCTACNGQGGEGSVVYDVDPADGHKNVKNGDYIFGEGNKVTVPVKCEVCGEESTIEGDIISENLVPTCTQKAHRVIKYTDATGTYTETVYEGELAKHYVLIGEEEVKAEFEEGKTYVYTDLGLVDSDFSGGSIPACNEPKVAWVTCAHCEVPYAVFATGEHKFNAEPDKDAEGNVLTQPATCTEDGYTAKYTCTACNGEGGEGSIIYVVDEADGHSWTAEVANGIVNLTCECGATQSGIIVSWANAEGVVFVDANGDAILDYAKIVELASKCGENVVIKCNYKETEDGDVKVEDVELPGIKHSVEESDVIIIELTIGGVDYICEVQQCANCGEYYIVKKTPKAA